jgi:hypothetical protein
MIELERSPGNTSERKLLYQAMNYKKAMKLPSISTNHVPKMPRRIDYHMMEI